MAEEEQKDDIDVVEEKGNKSKLLIIIVGVLVIALIGVGAMMFLGDDEKAPEPVESSGEAAPVVKQPPIYHAVETPFVVNFAEQSNGAVRYLQVKLKVMARSQAVIDAFKLHDPAIQHELLLLFYGQNYDELNTSAGTKALQLATLTTINEVLSSDPAVEGQLEAVYFASLIMQ